MWEAATKGLPAEPSVRTVLSAALVWCVLKVASYSCYTAEEYFCSNIFEQGHFVFQGQ